MRVPTKHQGLFLTGAILVLLAAGGAAQTPFDITIDRVQDVTLGSTVSVPVVKTAGSEPIWGFDFLITFDTAVFSLTGVTPGEMFDIPGAYEWEYFESRIDTISGNTGFLRAVALANTNDGPHVPLNTSVPDGTILFTLEFQVTSDDAYWCAYVPLRFYWNDCGDNAIAPDSLGTLLAISDGVYDWTGYDYQDITYPGNPFPGIYGASDSCLADTTITRMIDFYNGGVEIDCMVFRGDINCNGIENEIADYMIYYQYFIEGPDAFGQIGDCAMQNSDVNADGNQLRIEDLIYLYRIIRGEASPYPYIPSVVPHDSIAVTFVQDDDTRTISLDYAEPLAGIHLVFNDSIVPGELLVADGIITYFGYEGNHTRVIITPEIFGSCCPDFVTDGAFLTYTGEALLIEAGAADYYDHVFHCSIENISSGLTIPFDFEISPVWDATLGGDISIPIIKKAGSGAVSGFDFLIAYDASALNLASVTPGTLFDTPGDYEWEYFLYSIGEIECNEPNCPSGLVRIVALAETNNGSHHPLETEIPDGTVLFTLDGQVTTSPTMENMFVPVRFFWIDCGDNGVAFGEFGDSLALSDHVYNVYGFEMTDTTYGLPGYYGAPNSCFGDVNPPVRYIDFLNGGFQILPMEEMEIILSIDSVTAQPGDSNIYVDVRLANPQDTIPGFSLLIYLDRNDLVQFGRSTDDTTAIDVQGSLISDWDMVIQRSLSGTYYDLKITALSNPLPPYDKAIPPATDGLLCRLILHAYDYIPLEVTDSTVRLMINDSPTQTAFSDQNGSIIGLDGEQYNPQTVSFTDGFVTLYMPTAGDANGDGMVNVGDVVFLISYIFNFGPAPYPLFAGDVNCDGEVNVADAVYLIVHIFQGGPPPVSDCL